MHVKQLASSSATDFKKHPEMPSGPIAFLTISVTEPTHQKQKSHRIEIVLEQL